MTSEEVHQLGIPYGIPMTLAFQLVKTLSDDGKALDEMKATLSAVVRDPNSYLGDLNAGRFATALVGKRFVPRSEPAPWREWGANFEERSLEQMRNACALPVAVAGALMPDAHVGYGLPIGGVLATDNAVIPYAVGVDIACRMKLSVMDLPPSLLESDVNRLKSAIARETQFGVGASFKNRREHSVMDRDWSVSPITKQNKDKAWSQLGTSGSGNHFVEFGTLTMDREELGLAPGCYLALLSHSGSRGTGASVADHYSKLAMKLHSELPDDLKHLAWLDMDSTEGQEYWAAMELMGEYAAANHACIHRHVAQSLGAKVILDVENHHNFAWKERHLDREVIVHRKGATPAGKGVLGVIPGSMATPGFIVRGKGDPASLNSASHGAGRTMSRKKAIETFTWEQAHEFLRSRGVTLMSAGLDEVPMVYKNIEEVMAAQKDLVEVLARFDPKLVKMAPSGERPED
jgi:tRNA-splicing ligase RtcB (3'-phosphate/5'-hydroxy nucleic acid ligase)